MLRVLIFALMGSLLVIFQGTAFSAANLLGGALPNTALILLVFFAVTNGSFLGEIVGTLIGLTYDLVGVLPFGLFILLCTLIGYVVGRLRNAFVSTHWLFWPIGITFISMILWNIILIVLSFIFNLNLNDQLFAIANLLEILYTVLFAPLLFFILGRLELLLTRRPGGIR